MSVCDMRVPKLPEVKKGRMKDLQQYEHFVTYKFRPVKPVLKREVPLNARVPQLHLISARASVQSNFAPAQV